MQIPNLEIPALTDASAPLVFEVPVGERAAVLVVDDHPATLEALAAVLATLDVEVASARSGREALRALLERDFAVILLDVNMPVMDGFETASLIRARPRSAHIPIIFVTAYSTADADRLKGYTAGGADYLLAPVQPEILRAKVRFFIDDYYRRRMLLRQAEELRYRAEEIERKNLLLEIASRMKSDFLANMSHELRRPLTSVLGFAEVLKRDGLNQKQQDYVNEIAASGEHLLSLINDILDLSKVEAGKMELELDRCNLGTLLRAGLGAVQEKAAAHRIALRTEIPAETGAIVLDVRKTRQIVYNLLANAVKFTPDGGEVRISACSAKRAEIRLDQTSEFASRLLPLPESGFDLFAQIEVRDTGIGIAAADMGRLFQVFTRLESASLQSTEGTGLGLALVARLAALHGGTAGVQSAPGKGSRFVVWLPWRAEKDLPTSGAGQAGSENRKTAA